MKRSLLVIVCLVGMSVVNAGSRPSARVDSIAKASTFQELHRGIGEKLISVCKEFPATQKQVYPILDQIGKFHTEAQSLCQAHGEIIEKMMSLEQKIAQLEATHKSAIEELAALKARFSQAKVDVELMSKKFASYQADFERKLAEKTKTEEQRAELLAIAESQSTKASKLGLKKGEMIEQNT